MIIILVPIAILALSLCAVIGTGMQEKNETEEHSEQIPRVAITQKVPGAFDAFKKSDKKSSKR